MHVNVGWKANKSGQTKAKCRGRLSALLVIDDRDVVDRVHTITKTLKGGSQSFGSWNETIFEQRKTSLFREILACLHLSRAIPSSSPRLSVYPRRGKLTKTADRQTSTRRLGAQYRWKVFSILLESAFQFRDKKTKSRSHSPRPIPKDRKR